MANPLAEAFVRIRPMSAGFGKEMQSQLDAEGRTAGASGAKAGESFAAGMKSKVSKLAKGISEGTIGAAVAIGAASIDMAAKFQTGLNTLVTSAGESEKNLKMVGDGIKQIAVGTGTATADLVKGMYMIESAGYHGAAGLTVLKAAAQGAKSENASLAVVTNAVTTVMTDYRLPVDKATNAMNALIGITSHGKTTLEALAGSMSTVLPVAAAAHLSLGEVGGAMATMTAEGVSADEAAQLLRHTIVALQSPSNVQAQQMQQLGVNSNQLAKNLGKTGLAGTIQQLEEVILRNMGPAGLVLLKSFNQSKLAAKSAQDQIDAMPASLQKLAQSYQAGTITSMGMRTAIYALSAPQANLMKQFEATTNLAHGFNTQLKAGGGNAQTFTAALSKVMGGAEGLQVALDVGGSHMATYKANVAGVGAAFNDSSGKVNGFALVQQSLGFKMDQVRQVIATTGISIGQKLIPYLSDMAGWAMKNQRLIANLGLAFAGAAIAITAVYTAVKAVGIIKTVFTTIKDGVAAVKGFVIAAKAAALATDGLELAQGAAAASNAAFAVSADGTAVALGTLTAGETAASVAGAALAAVNPAVWVAGGIAAMGALAVAMLHTGDGIRSTTDAMSKQDDATGYNIAGYQKLAKQTTATAVSTGKLGAAVKSDSNVIVAARVGAIAYAGSIGAVSQVHQQAASTAANLQTRMTSLTGEFALTTGNAEKLAARSGVTAQQLGATGQAGQDAYGKIAAYGQGAGAAAVKSMQLQQASGAVSDALAQVNDNLLTGQGDLLSWQGAMSSATQAIRDSSTGLKGNSQAAIDARQAMLGSTQQAIEFADHEATLNGGMGTATKTIQQQIGWLQKHGDKSHFATMEVDALRIALAKIKSEHARLVVSGTGTYHVVAGGPMPGVASGGGGGHTAFGAAGGLIRGGSGPVADDVPLWASSGEYMVKAASVAKYGVRAMDAINAGRFAAGGLVGGYDGTPSGLGQFFTAQTNATLKALEAATARAAAGAIQQRQSAIPGGGDLGAHGGNAAANQAIARQLLPLFGFGIGQMPFLVELWNRESNWNQLARNSSSGAYGIPQSLPADKMAAAGADWLTNPQTQERWGLSYIKGRYGNPAGAWAHETNYGWYDRGGMLQPGWTMAYNGTGRPEPVGAPSNAGIEARLDALIMLLRQAPAATGAATSRGVGAALSGTGRRAVARGQYPSRGGWL